MNTTIEVRQDHQRGCGWRKEGGLYLISKGEGMPCCKMPFELTVCPCCSQGIKHSRGWTWIDAGKLFPASACALPSSCCPLADPKKLGRMGLLWVGEAFYATPAEFVAEAAKLGISRRINSVPKDLELGKTWVAFAHIHVIEKSCGNGEPCEGSECEVCGGTGKIKVPAIFYLFKPEAIEYVTTGKETEEELAAIVKRGITPVRIERIGETKEMGL